MRDKVVRDTTITAKTKTKLLEQVDEIAKQDPLSVQQSVADFSRAEAYTKGGTRLKGINGKYAGYLREAYKDIWSEKAPEVLRETNNMAKLFKIKRNLKNTAIATGITAGGVGGASYLYNFLRGRTGGNQ